MSDELRQETKAKPVSQLDKPGTIVHGSVAAGRDFIGRDQVTKIVNVYGQPVQAAKVSATNIATANTWLAELPLGIVPPIPPLPDGSRMLYRPNPLFVGRRGRPKAFGSGA